MLVAYRNRSGKEEFLRLITTLTPAEAVERYQQRYRIESIGAARRFKHLKSNGFDWEALHMEYGYKIRLMMAVVVLAYTLAITYGLADFKRKVRLKKHGSPEMSVFRWVWTNGKPIYSNWIALWKNYTISQVAGSKMIVSS